MWGQIFQMHSKPDFDMFSTKNWSHIFQNAQLLFRSLPPSKGSDSQKSATPSMMSYFYNLITYCDA